MGPENAVTLVGLAGSFIAFLLALAFQIGRLSQRVDHLEQWRSELRGDMNGIFGAIRNLEGLIRGEGQ